MNTTRALVPLALLLFALPARAEVDEKQFNDAKKAANRYMKVAGEGIKKERALQVLARDDSLRAAQVLIKWVKASQALRERELIPAYAEAKERLDQVVGQLQKAYVEKYTDTNKNGQYDKGEPFKDNVKKNGKRDGWPPRTMDAKHKNSWETLKKKKALAENWLQVEDMVLASIGRAFEYTTDVEALRWLASEGVDALDKAKEPGPVRLGLVGGLIRLDGKWCIDKLIELGGPEGDIRARLRVINWAGMAKSKEAWKLVVGALKGKHVVVQRAAVAALKNYDDPRAVKLLIDALGKAKGLLAQEIDRVLFWYVGHAFEGDVKIWRKWWKHEGEGWLEKKPTERHKPKKVTKSHTTTAIPTTFYDIPTESKRIVFVLDRSGSMKEKARHVPKKNPAKPKPKKKGPVVTGDKRKSKKSDKDEKEDEDGPLEGSNKLEVAKSKLGQTIRRMAKDVHFNVVFYSTDVSVWRKPPSMHEGTKPNKSDAIKWFSGQDPEGSTSLFPALMKALEYAEAFGAAGDKKKRKKGSSGANTIFLLSDGSPTAKGGGGQLPQGEIEKQLKRFLKKNELYRVVVHTIGVGPGHNRSLMRRIASATGGEYRAVGVD